jgi:hypothetical protein
MAINAPTPFREALRRLFVRRTMPTTLSTAQIQQLDADIQRGSLYSARTTLRGYLERIRETITTILDPKSGSRVREDGTPITEGMNMADARLALKRELQALNYQPDPDKRGTIQDLSSDRRIELVVRTNTEISQGYGQWVQGQDPAVLDAFPAQELYRAGSPKVARNWKHRWRAAAGAVGDTDAIRILSETGKLIARKDSPIWQALGDGLGLTADEGDDALHNPYPPFAFNSSMDVRDVDRTTAVDLGLVRMEEQLQPQTQEFPLAEEATA